MDVQGRESAWANGAYHPRQLHDMTRNMDPRTGGHARGGEGRAGREFTQWRLLLPHLLTRHRMCRR